MKEQSLKVREVKACGIISPTDFLTESVTIVTETSPSIFSIVTRYFQSSFFGFLLLTVVSYNIEDL